jgi:hypothetical protein
VFDTANGFSGVWHFGNPGAAGTDATAHGNDGVDHGNQSAKGIVGLGQYFAPTEQGLDDDDNYIVWNDVSRLRVTGPEITITIWARPTGMPNAYPNVLGADGPQADGHYWQLWWGTPGHDELWGGRLRTVDGASDTYKSIYCNDGPFDTWSHLTIQLGGGRSRIFHNGTARDSSSQAGTVAAIDRFMIGSNIYHASSRDFEGYVDEARVSRVARSASWIKLSYENQKPGSKAVTVTRYR